MLIFLTEIKWLSRGKVLTRLIELRTEVSSFLMDRNATLAETMNEVICLCQVSFLENIFNKINNRNNRSEAILLPREPR